MSSRNTRYVLRALNEEQRQQWDGFVGGHPCGHLLQSWGWGELKARVGWHPLRLALWDKQEQRIAAAAQILRRTAPHVPLYTGHLAYIPKGPVIDWSDTLLREVFFSQLTPYLRIRGALALQMELAQETGSTDSEQIQASIASLRMHSVHAIQPLRTIMLDIVPDEETLLAQMKEKWRYNVRLAGRKGVTIRVAETLEDLKTWYGLLQVTSERDQFGIHTLDYYLNIWDLFVTANTAKLFLAEYDGQLLAGIFVGLFAQQAMYLYGASSNEQRQLMPNYLLQWEAIRWSRRVGAKVYDFWGIPDTEAEDEAMAGVYRFKRGWGGRVVEFLGCYEKVYNPLGMRIAQKFLERT
jgi:lipid II:glycine glycyltransferase (peptidoglycan interpeptide bridge formation enzyme)